MCTVLRVPFEPNTDLIRESLAEYYKEPVHVNPDVAYALKIRSFENLTDDSWAWAADEQEGIVIGWEKRYLFYSHKRALEVATDWFNRRWEARVVTVRRARRTPTSPSSREGER